ncbi:MAG: M24 family metallopeptidase [Calditrichaeota bacterium]|nr:M24 family metallopeptidase [Calditrichota bacterium]
MSRFRYLVIGFVMISGVACQNPAPENPDTNLWKGLPAHVNTPREIQEELQEKMERIQQFLKKERLKGILLTQVRNVYWATAGLANNQIVLNKDVGAASLLIRADGKKFLICNGSEAARLMDESLRKLGYQLKMYNWYEANPVKDVRGQIIRELSLGGRIGSDVPFPETVLVADAFKRLRYQLTPSEIKRYTWLGKQVAEAVETVCRQLRPGMDEFEIEARTAAALRARGILPTVLLIGVDERIYKYRHALPAGARLKNYAMVNVVAEKWGMPVAVTRLVHFGPLPEELKIKLEKTAIVNAHFQEATRPGTPCADIFESCKRWYAEVGFPGEWQKHHQGGAIGYDDREYVLYPGIPEVVLANQAFAWNPTITGAKVEDTMIATEEGFRVITRTGNWPLINVHLNGKVYPQPAILVLDPETGAVLNEEAIDIP